MGIQSEQIVDGEPEGVVQVATGGRKTLGRNGDPSPAVT